MLDTSVVIQLRDADSAIGARVSRLRGEVLLSIVTRVELEGGVYSRAHLAASRRARLNLLLPAFDIVPFGEDAADAYRRIVEAAGHSRRKLLDRMIAAQALVHRATLITLNGEDFRDVPDLTYEDWGVGPQPA